MTLVLLYLNLSHLLIYKSFCCLSCFSFVKFRSWISFKFCLLFLFKTDFWKHCWRLLSSLNWDASFTFCATKSYLWTPIPFIRSVSSFEILNFLTVSHSIRLALPLNRIGWTIGLIRTCPLHVREAVLGTF